MNQSFTQTDAPSPTDQAANRRPDAAAPDPLLLATPDPRANNRAIMIGGCAVGAGLVLCGLGLMFGGRSAASTPVVPVPVANSYSEQQRMVHEAMETAREANQLQRERLQLMRQAMQNGEEHMPDQDSSDR